MSENGEQKSGAPAKASDLFIRCLEAEGVTHIFGVPGEENADVMMSLMDSSIDFVLCRHEQAAAFMADTYGRLTGRPGVCLATLGPGATNLVTGVADANMDRSPLVAIIGQASTSRLHKESHQNMDAIAMFKPITKWAHSIGNANTIPEVVRKAFKVATTEKPGATVIELPEDLAKVQLSSAPMPVDVTRRPAADYKAVARAVELIAAAKKPLILAGNGTVRKRASAQLRRLAKKTGIGVVNTFMGKGA
ncbi:MAG: acetolactate synthase large subunit, partial [Rhodospirillaceae bacterium]|nr:acetolactate synthase large subunit [Rhodospirillaceae bacterium]